MVARLLRSLFVDECCWSRILTAPVSLWRRDGFHLAYHSVFSRQSLASLQLPEAMSKIVSYYFRTLSTTTAVSGNY
jgi:hypothetical protein